MTKREEKQKELIKTLKEYIWRGKHPSDSSEYWDKIQKLESEIAELENEGREPTNAEREQWENEHQPDYLPPDSKQPGKSAEYPSIDQLIPKSRLLIKDGIEWIPKTTAKQALQEYRTAGMPGEEKIESEAHRIAMYKGFTYSAAKRKDDYIRMAKWVITKWKGE